MELAAEELAEGGRAAAQEAGERQVGGRGAELGVEPGSTTIW